MLNWIKRLYHNLRAKHYSIRRIEKAYFDRDSLFLQRAYQYGYSYQKRLAIQYLGSIPVQTNLDFLLKEMKSVAQIKLRAYILQSTLALAEDSTLIITDSDHLFLNQHLTLLRFIARSQIAAEPEKAVGVPISFRHRRTDLLGRLEDIKRACEWT
ncbi:MAG: hypothetical protein HRU41_21500 [Saprospiraceae bacterium]|nr:hypothetical protein [Saprospiraceae bacterium]